MRFLVSLIILLPLLSTRSCTLYINRKTNEMVEGTFVQELDDRNYYFVVTKIDKEEFVAANGLNVVEDLVYKKKTPRFYSVSFYSVSLNDENDKINYNFYNLRDRHEKVVSEPICYDDDNWNSIVPYAGQFNDLYFVRHSDIKITYEDISK